VARLSRRALAQRAAAVGELLAEHYPGTAKQLCALRHKGPFQLLVATILSAQCTDERVNLVTPALFARFPNQRALAAARPEEVEMLIRPTGFFRSKTAHLIAMAGALVERHPRRFPTEMSELTALPGVGRKTANVVRSVALGLPGLPVDTHVLRVSHRLGLTGSTDPVKVEVDLCALYPEDEWGALSVRLILHGRRVCAARKPRCPQCRLAPLCPSAALGSLTVPPTVKERARRPAGTTASGTHPAREKKRAGSTSGKVKRQN
jgi:endonuclease-3